MLLLSIPLLLELASNHVFLRICDFRVAVSKKYTGALSEIPGTEIAPEGNIFIYEMRQLGRGAQV